MTDDRASDLLAELPPVKRLALSYAPSLARQATLALLALDERMAKMLRAAREPLATQLRLAWWRETLEQPRTEWPRGDPILDALRGWREPAALAPLANGWEALLAERLTPTVIADFVDGRGQAFAGLAREFGAEPAEDAAQAARVWALADLAANISDGDERELVVAYGRRQTMPRLSPYLRPLAILAGLGARALEQGGTPLLAGPGSALMALRIGMTGR